MGKWHFRRIQEKCSQLFPVQRGGRYGNFLISQVPPVSTLSQCSSIWRLLRSHSRLGNPSTAVGSVTCPLSAWPVKYLCKTSAGREYSPRSLPPFSFHAGPDHSDQLLLHCVAYLTYDTYMSLSERDHQLALRIWIINFN